MTEKSCGTIPYTVKDGIVYYLLIKTKRNGNCGFPKGHVEAGENEIETAYRETVEETSVTPDINGDFRYEMSYTLNNGNLKTVVFFPADFRDQIPKHNEGFEHYDYLILPFEEAYQRLTFANSKIMLKKADEYLMKTLF